MLGLDQHANDEGMQNFNLLSHSFGVQNLQNHILFLHNYLQEEFQIIKSMFAHV